MKTLADGFTVSSKSYYFLLEWNEQDNKQFISEKFSKQKLNELDKEEYMILWLNATTNEYNQMCRIENKLEDSSKDNTHFTEADILMAYTIGYKTDNTEKENEGEKVLRAFKRADELNKNIQWE